MINFDIYNTSFYKKNLHPMNIDKGPRKCVKIEEIKIREPNKRVWQIQKEKPYKEC